MELREGVCRAWYSVSKQTLMKCTMKCWNRVMAVYKAKGVAKTLIVNLKHMLNVKESVFYQILNLN